MGRKILIILSIAFIITGCQRDNIPYEEVSKSELKKLLNTNFDTDKEQCGWSYGRNSEYHLFELTCVKKKRPRNSFLTIKKRVKINLKEIDIEVSDDLKILPKYYKPYIAIYRDNVIIKW